MAALSLATDLGLGQPLEHELGVCLAALELAERLGCDPEEASHVYYVALAAHVGCTGVAPHFAEWVGGDDIHFQSGVQVLGPVSEPAEDLRHFLRHFADDRPLRERVILLGRLLIAGDARAKLMAANLCEGAAVLARRLHLPDEVTRALAQLTERWDGKGFPGEAAGDEISRPLRILRVAQDLVTIARAQDLRAAIAALERRRGRGYDPEVVDVALADPDALSRAGEVSDVWERVIDAEPEPVATISAAGLLTIARAIGEFVDVKVGFLHGHSTRVAELAATGAEHLGCSGAEASRIRAAGFLHDLGRVSVPNGIWDKEAPLSASEWERVRLHPYYTERVLERSEALAGLARVAGAHHERLDGTGYHRQAAGAQLDLGSRLLAAADVYDALTHERPYRKAASPAGARAGLGESVRSGAIDKRAADAVLEVAGSSPLDVRQGHPAGLTEREAEVLRLVARGRTSREIAQALVITEKTAGHHIEHIYAKTGVSTRVGAALFAMQHDLIA
jgi:HD-GYP domain-containing protein (c-di-GMP phosphodiesterase class II)